MNRIEDKSLGELIDKYLSLEKAEEFDAILEREEQKKSRIRTFCWSVAGAVAVACMAVLLVPSLPEQGPATELTGIQIAEGIQHILEIDPGDIETISAKPMGDKAMITAYMRNGKICTYIMSCNGDDGSTSIVAYNQKQE